MNVSLNQRISNIHKMALTPNKLLRKSEHYIIYNIYRSKLRHSGEASKPVTVRQLG